MSIPVMAGVTAKTITTDRITTRVLFTDPENGVPVLFLHGNASSATWWEENMVALPPGYRGIALDQRSFGDADPDKKVDATRGTGDWADDAVALLDHIRLTEAQNPFFAVIDNDPEAYRHIRTPTLILTGDQDRAIPPWQQVKLLEILPNARQVLPGSGHMVYMERPDIFWPTVRAFVTAKSVTFCL